MKKILVIIIVLSSVAANAQQFIGAASLGFNLTQVDGDEIFGFKKFGLNASAAAFYPFADKWFVSVEIQFAQKGAYQKYPFVQDPTKSLPFYKLKLDYLEVPLMIHFLDKKFLMIGAGISFSRLVRLKEVEWGVTTHNSVATGPYDRDDYSWIIDVRVPLKNRLKLNVRYSYSSDKIRTRQFSNISGNEWTRDQFNNVITLRLVYMFNEEIEKE
jgi:hypothetical protein